MGQEDENKGGVQEGDRLQENEQVEKGNEDALPQDGEFGVPNFVIRRVMISKAIDDPSQRENLFHTKCLIKENICSLVINSRSCANVASATMVNLLKLPITKHATPYKIQWLNECGELKVTRQVVIRFKIGNYHNEILCDVIPMQACHIFLGRPW